MALHKRKGLGVKPHVLITPALSMCVCVWGGACMGVGWRQEDCWDLLDASLASGPVKDSRE